MNERIRNYNKYLELLTNTVSHEMLTPLNSIINLSRMINEKIEKEKKNDFRNSRSIIDFI